MDADWQCPDGPIRWRRELEWENRIARRRRQAHGNGGHPIACPSSPDRLHRGGNLSAVGDVDRRLLRTSAENDGGIRPRRTPDALVGRGAESLCDRDKLDQHDGGPCAGVRIESGLASVAAADWTRADSTGLSDHSADPAVESDFNL